MISRIKTPFMKPYRVETRSSIVVYDANDRVIAEWWDDDVEDMFESGYFTSNKGERALADSVLAYVEEMKVHRIPGRRNPPLPSSALMESATARSIVREVLDKKRPVGDLSRAVDLLQQAHDKLLDSHKEHIDFQNPPAVEIYRDLVEIKAIKRDGKRYVHKFSSGSSIFGLPDGDILIRSRKGKRLWKNFEVEG